MPKGRMTGLALAAPGARAAAGGGGVQGRYEALIQVEQESEARGLGREAARLTIGSIYRAVIRGMGGNQIGRHGQRIIEISKAGAGMRGPRIQNALGRAFNGGALRLGWVGPGEVVVYDVA